MIKMNMQQVSRGTTQDNLSLDKLLTFDFQMSASSYAAAEIADILSAYDDLIQNNTRRIAILEEMARSLYREWFVDFRFPGTSRCHGRIRVGLVPEGWEEKLARSRREYESLKRGHGLQTINYVDITSVATGRVERIDSLPFPSAPSRARRIVRNGDTVWSTVGPNREAIASSWIPTVAYRIHRLRCDQTPDGAMLNLYHTVTTENSAEYLTNHAKGTHTPR